MRIEVRKRVGIITLLLVYVLLLFLVVGYVYIACSTKSDNLFSVPYEPSGIQMLYYYFTLPLFAVLMSINYCLNIWLKINKAYAIIPLITWLIFYIFIEYIDKAMSFPSGNELFYQGSLLIALVSLSLLMISAYCQIKAALKIHE